MDEIIDQKAEALIDKFVAQPETVRFESKRVSGKMVGKALETICAFANTAGGTLALGLEDPGKAKGHDRLYGLEENPEAVDELRRKTLTHLLPAVEGLRWVRVACRLRDGREGHVLLLIVPQSPKVHSILDEGTWARLDASNREMSAAEITELSYRRGVISAESEPVAVPNLLKPPKTLSGPLPMQITQASAYVLDELAAGLTLAESGFKTVHRYPERVIKEAITNAVIHRDYRLNRDIQIRIFDNRIEIESPGLFPGTITPSNVAKVGSFARNPLIARNLREFPEPPNVDAGEGVRMMFAEMRAANLYPPFYGENRDAAQPSVIVSLRNEERPPIWEQVSDWMDCNGPLANSDLCQIAGMDTLKASKMLKRWVEQGVLLRDDTAGKRHTVYRKPMPDGAVETASSLSLALDNGPTE